MNRRIIVAALLGTLLWTTMVLAQDSLNVSRLGQLHYWGMTQDAAISGSYAYVLEVEIGLRVLDVSDPTYMEEVGSCGFNEASCVAANGSYVYVGTFGGLYLVDVADPSSPRVVGFCPTASLVHDIEIVYPYAYLAIYGQGLSILNVSNPAAPVVVGGFNNPGPALSVAVADSRAYLAEGSGGVWILDVSTPAAPVPVGHFFTPNYAKDLCVVDSLAYVLDGEGIGSPGAGLMIFDVSNPASSVLLGSCGSYVDAGDVKVSGDYAYVPIWGRGLRIIDVSHPATPHEVFCYMGDNDVFEMQLSGSIAYLTGSGLTVLSLANPIVPVQLGYYYQTQDAREMVVVGSYAYVCKFSRGLEVLEISDPAHPRWVSFFASTGGAHDVDVALPYAYLADLSSGLRIIDVSDPERPAEAGSYNPPEVTVGSVALHYPYAYLAAFGHGLITLDVSDPHAPVPVGTITSINATHVTVEGSYAYVGDDDGQMRILSLANPAAPVLLGSVNVTGQLYEIAVTGSSACLATNMGLRIVDVSNPAAPALVYNGSSWVAWDLDADGSLVYLTTQSPGLLVLNITNPAAPVEVGYYTLMYYNAMGLKVVNSIVYLGREYTFETYDCSACNAPAAVTLTPLNPPVYIPAAGGSFQYNTTLVNLTPTQQTFDAWIMVRLPNQTWYGPVLGPLNLTLPGGAQVTRRRTQSVPASAPAGYFLYEAHLGDYPNTVWGLDMISILKNTAEGGDGPPIVDWAISGDDFGATEMPLITHNSALITSISPNPFNATTAISYELRASSYVKLTVFDINGRDVGARLASPLQDGWQGAGTYKATFDGSKLASGVYLARLQAGEFTQTQKVVLLK
jgi:hypothetical protein